MPTKYKNKLSEEKVKQANELIEGLTYNQWCSIKGAVNYVYSQKAGNVRIDGLEDKGLVNELLKL